MIKPLDRAEVLATLTTRFATRAEEYDRTGAFPHDNFTFLKEADLLALTAPPEYGGRGGGLAEAVEVVGAVAAGEPSTGLILTMQYMHLATLPLGCWPRAQAERVVQDAIADGALVNALRVEPLLGTPTRGGLPATIARRTAAGWSLDGRKIYSTGIEGLTWAVVWARTDEPTPRVGPFLVPAAHPRLRIEKTWNTLGMRATGSHDVIFENVDIPFEHGLDLRSVEQWQNGSEPGQPVWLSLLLGALYDGVARAARNWIVHFLKNRVPTNLGAPLATLPRMQEAVGAIEERLSVNARLLTSAARDNDEGRPPSINEAFLIKLTVTENAIAAVEQAVKLAGNNAIARANPLERHLRDVLCARIHSPQEDSVRLAAGRRALAA